MHEALYELSKHFSKKLALLSEFSWFKPRYLEADDMFVLFCPSAAVEDLDMPAEAGEGGLWCFLTLSQSRKHQENLLFS